MMREIDDQLDGRTPDLVVTPVGVGSLAQAVVVHFKAEGRSTAVLTVEPDTAACLWKSLKKGEVAPSEPLQPSWRDWTAVLCLVLLGLCFHVE